LALRFAGAGAMRLRAGAGWLVRIMLVRGRRGRGGK